MSLDEDRELLRGAVGERVTKWLAGTDNPGEALRIGCAAEVVRMFVRSNDAATASSWLWGTCAELDDHCPIEVLRSSTSRAEADTVVAAARSFISDPGYR